MVLPCTLQTLDFGYNKIYAKQPQADRLGTSDPKCFVVWNGDKAGSTATLYRTLDPRWDHQKEAFSLRLPRDRSMCECYIDVWDMDFAGTKKG